LAPGSITIVVAYPCFEGSAARLTGTLLQEHQFVGGLPGAQGTAFRQSWTTHLSSDFAKAWRKNHKNGAYKVKNSICVTLSVVALGICLPSAAQEPGVAKPQVLLQQIVQGLPTGEKQEVRVLTASFNPGDRTLFHTHRFPVTVYVLEGAFTLEMAGRAPVTLSAGQAMVEPPHVQMTGYNRSSTDSLRVVIFYASDPGTPFLDVLH
jgi:quercetin dioxygenase-like cupin family protein